MITSGAPNLSSALVRISDASGATKGTGFFVSNEGHILTCHHVVSGLESIRVEGGTFSSPAVIEEQYSVPSLDVVTLRTDIKAPALLPVAFGWNAGDTFWASGFHRQSAMIRASLPILGKIAGSTAIKYQSRLDTYSLSCALRIEDSAIDHGLSGAPAVLAGEHVVIGIVNTKYEGGGFVLPFECDQGRASRLYPLLVRNRRHVPQYGRFLSPAGLVAACQLQLKRSLDRLITSRQFLPDFYVARTEAEDEIAVFLRTLYTIVPVIGASGVGKTQLLAKLAERLSSERPTVFL